MQFFLNFFQFPLNVSVHLRGTCKGRVFDERDDFTFYVGLLPDDDLCAGVQKSLKYFAKGDVCRFVFCAHAFVVRHLSFALSLLRIHYEFSSRGKGLNK